MPDLDMAAEGRTTRTMLDRLTSAERSRRMLVLRAVAEAEQLQKDRIDGPLPPVSRAVALLVTVEHKDPEAVSELLGHPGTGIWAVRMLRRLHLPPARRTAGEPPLWHELGYAHCLAAAALLRSRVPGTVRVPAGPGGICLPTLGTVEVPSTEGSAVLHVRPNGEASVALGSMRVTLPADPRQPGFAWRPTPRLSWQPDGTEHHLMLEDADPYRTPQPDTANVPLSAGEAGLWRRRLDEAGELLAARHADIGRMLALTLRTLVPLPTMPPFRTSSASHSDAFGHALLSLPHSAVDMAVTLIHEARHSLLNGISHQIRLFEPVRSPLLYAPWRSDPRPAPGLLHGAYAFAGVTEFWRTERHALSGPGADLAHFEFAVWRQAVFRTLTTLRTSGELSHWGRRFVTHMADRATAWSDDPVPHGLQKLADAETADRWATWRIRHLRPEQGVAAELSARWLDGARAACTGRSLLRSVIRAEPPEPRAELRRRRLLGMLPARNVETSAADLLLVRGEATMATEGYLDMLTRDPGTRSAWIGLGLALRLDGTPAVQVASRVLLHHPEVVRAVHLRVRALSGAPPHPVELADWMGR